MKHSKFLALSMLLFSAYLSASVNSSEDVGRSDQSEHGNHRFQRDRQGFGDRRQGKEIDAATQDRVKQNIKSLTNDGVIAYMQSLQAKIASWDAATVTEAQKAELQQNIQDAHAAMKMVGQPVRAEFKKLKTSAAALLPDMKQQGEVKDQEKSGRKERRGGQARQNKSKESSKNNTKS
jgi:hypothetical protein